MIKGLRWVLGTVLRRPIQLRPTTRLVAVARSRCRCCLERKKMTNCSRRRLTWRSTSSIPTLPQQRWVRSNRLHRKDRGKSFLAAILLSQIIKCPWETSQTWWCPKSRQVHLSNNSHSYKSEAEAPHKTVRVRQDRHAESEIWLSTYSRPPQVLITISPQGIRTSKIAPSKCRKAPSSSQHHPLTDNSHTTAVFVPPKIVAAVMTYAIIPSRIKDYSELEARLLADSEILLRYICKTSPISGTWEIIRIR